ncbi:MAG: CoA-binding protein [Planctomycetes bacterium]|nr:CoA-binding protein [Planctomycetota bacterium]
MDAIKSFFQGKCFAVAGASTDGSKYGNLVFRALVESGRRVYPINPKGGLIEGHKSFPKLSDLPEVPDSLSIVTPPEVTRSVVAEAIALGVPNIWMQPGADDPIASEAARAAGAQVIDDGSCILVLLKRL